MGEIAEMMLDGTLCQQCGEFMGDECGYSRTCKGCSSDAKQALTKASCPRCHKRVKITGLTDHLRDVHKVKS